MPETGVTSQGIVDEANSKMRRHMRAKKLAYKACVEINPAHPEDVPALIPEMVKRLHEIRDAFKTAELAVTSWSVDGGPDCPPHPWHEEWFHHVDALLSRLNPKKEDGDGT